MPYLNYVPLTKNIGVGIALIALSISSAWAADWHACESAKLREIRTQRSDKPLPGSHRHKKHRAASRTETDGRTETAEEIDTWLWKNCREYSYELRQLEQDRM